MYYMGDMDGFGWFGMLLFIGLAVWLIVWIINNSKGQTQETREQGQKEKTPLQIVKERYAKGQITKKEYEEMRNELQ